MNYKMIRYIIGNLLMVEGVLLLLPAITALIYQEDCLWIFLAVVVLCEIIGYLMRKNKPKNVKIYSSEGYVCVALCWIVTSIFGGLPLFFSGFYPNPFDALFEIVSGFTTTGATVIADVEALPKAILIWRSFSHWIGGMGILVFMLAILPVSGGSSMHLMKAETPGPSVGKLVPKIRSTAMTLYGIYLAMTLIQMMLLMLAGASVFDSINLTFSTAGTGGFSILNTSTATYNPAILTILAVFMVLFGINFNVYFLIYVKNFREAWKCEEMRFYFALIFAAGAAITINILPNFASAAEALLHSFFQVIAIITTTGFYTQNFNLWPEFSKVILVLLMFTGGCAGSTSCGIKLSRILIMFKSIIKELYSITHPRSIRKIRLEGKPVEHDVVRSVNVFIMAYIFIFVFSLLIISLDNKDGITNFTSVLACLNNIGPGLALVGPIENFSHFSNLSKLVFTFDMLIGRLELFPMLVLCSPELWRKRWH